LTIEELKISLYDYKQIDRKLFRQDRLIKEYREETDAIRYTAHPQEVSDMPHGTEVSDPVYSAAVKTLEGQYRDYIKLCKKEIVRLKNIKCTLDFALSLLKGKEKGIIYLRYQKGKT
jgi:hypothetical protein